MFFPGEFIAGHSNSESMIRLTQLPVSLMWMATTELDILSPLPSQQSSDWINICHSTCFDPSQTCPYNTVFSWISNLSFQHLHSPQENHQKWKRKLNAWMKPQCEAFTQTIAHLIAQHKDLQGLNKNAFFCVTWGTGSQHTWNMF